jgi:hypothetical protein
MAILIVEHLGTLQGASLSGRVLIGRRESNHVVVDHPDVSRIHAWIDTADRNFCLTDAGSRTGTFVNGIRVAGKVNLHHGDQIGVGPAKLIFRADGSLPAGVSQLDFREAAAAAAAQKTDGGILFDCPCGAPLWIASQFAGRNGKCRFCGSIVRVPEASGAVAERVEIADARQGNLFDDATLTATRSTTSTATQFCGVCQSSIEPGESTTICPDCGLTFHRDSWRENFGCSAYGCSQVNVLRPPIPTAAAGGDDAGESLAVSQQQEQEAIAEAKAAKKIPTEFALLGASVLGLLVGAFTFGVPALASLVATFTYMKKRRGQRVPPVVLSAAAISVVGVVLGVTVSYIWWLRDAAPAANVLNV